MARRADEPERAHPYHDPDKYRDNDDERDPLPAEKRVDTKPDTKSEARGDAREDVGNTARGTAAHPTGPKQSGRTRPRKT